ncbi:uncharacterized protein LAESUDRAFT_742646 [Laetiporus sulphureus 93-53]|uniref:Uncharacterized protein n=1 Tax=Laetiporus sulphureus 93-53 TaxID=1314785 RepID=A0A165F3A5_9APHY|nr:uncharacterized protein LAESUDRAFT_742646 [Laetiporus sulphureus 93-53]KZT08289.1 hypothetical protein LAESUDRAFT_742646 [Laetiporus sulphureus 93-53]
MTVSRYLCDFILAGLFKLLWAPSLVPTPNDTDEVRFNKEHMYDPNWPRSLVLIIHHTRRPFHNFFLLLWPYPWHFALQPLYSSFEFLQHPELADELHSDDLRLHYFPPYRARDTPLRSLYRMHAWICAGGKHRPLLGYETQYFLSHIGPEWKLENLPDPQDPDPVRYAVLAGLVETMVLSFNERYSEMKLPRMGEGISVMYRKKLKREGREVDYATLKERAPEWVAPVPPVEGPPVQLAMIKQEGVAIQFRKRNILISGSGHMFWV